MPIVFTDSKSVLEAIGNYSPLKKLNTSHIILAIHTRLFSLKQQQIKVKLVWIPAHCKINHNEKVDELAKDVINGPTLKVLLYYSDFEEMLNTNIKRKHNETLIGEGRFK